MKFIRLTEALDNLICSPKFITVSGGGGKTSLLNVLGLYYKEKGNKVLLTTTTKFQAQNFYNWNCDLFFSKNNEILDVNIENPCVVLFANEYDYDQSKLQAPDTGILEKIYKRYDISICEADGSKGLPLKIHSLRDPVIPDFTTCRIAVVGIWGIGQKIKDSAFGIDREGFVDKDFFEEYISSPQGLLKGNVDIVVVNGAESASQEQLAVVANANWPQNVKVLAGSIKNDALTEVIR